MRGGSVVGDNGQKGKKAVGLCAQRGLAYICNTGLRMCNPLSLGSEPILKCKDNLLKVHGERFVKEICTCRGL